MTPTELLDAVLAAPDDDLPRLVWADWLEERGDDARAAFVRVQCALARHPEPWSAEAVLLRHREFELLARHGRAWVAEAGTIDGVRWTRFERGLLVGITVPDLATLVARADEIRARAPVSEVTVESAETPATAPALPWLRALGFTELYDLTADQLQPLLDAPLVGALTALRLRDCGIENPGALAIAASPRLQHLEELDLSGCFVGEAGGVALAGAEHLRGLRRLRFGSQGSGYTEDPFLTDAAIEAFTDPAGPVRPLVELDLDLARITSASVQRLLTSDRLPHLARVRMRWCQEVEPDAFEVPPGPARWRQLVIDGLDAAVFRPLATLPQTSALRWLSVDGCSGVTPEALRDLAAGLGGTLQHLQLRYTQLDGAGLAALASRPWPALVRLDLGPGNGVDAAGAAHLTPAGFPALLELDLQNNPLGDDGAAAVARELGGQLLGLTLRQCKLEDDGARALASTHAPRLARLSVAGNSLLGPHGAQALGAAAFPALSHLDVSSTAADDTLLEALAANPVGQRLLSLAFDTCRDVTTAGIAALARAAPAALRSLSMSYVRVGPDALDALSEPDALPALTHLSAAYCDFDEPSLVRLTRSPLYDRLTWLSCAGNHAPRALVDTLGDKQGFSTADWPAVFED